MERLAYSNITIEHQNKAASIPLVMPVQLVANIDEAVINENIRTNTRLHGVEWLKEEPEHGTRAILCGSGPSLEDYLDEIDREQSAGAHVFAMNGAAGYLHENGIMPDFQVMLDAREQTLELIGPARQHLFCSQMHPSAFRQVPDAKMWHLAYPDIDELMPDDRPEHFICGGGAAVGATAALVCNALGYREMVFYGYDSSNAGRKSHAKHQPINDGEAGCFVQFNGKTYASSLTMKYQAERFQVIARALKGAGCRLTVKGDGLLPDMFNAPKEVLAEDEKYRRMWEFESYRVAAPGETCVPKFLEITKIDEGETVMDFGCGTGRAAVLLAEAGLRVVTVDFADNCRDTAALRLPFLLHDLREPLAGVDVPFGFCTDVMEHIEPEQVDSVIRNIMAAAETVFFQISTMPDQMGALIGHPLHLTVRPFEWWRELFGKMGYEVGWSDHDAIACQFVASRKDSEA